MSDQSWQYRPAADLDKPLTERLREFPREPDMLVYGLRWVSAVAQRLYLRTYHRLQIMGQENLPAKGSFVMVANHASHLDALCILASLPYARIHHAYPTAAKDYFFVSLPRVAVAAICVNAIPFARKAHSRQSLDLCRKLLYESGNVLILFPEGTRTTNGSLGDFRPGIGSLVAGTNIPVIPCAIHGTYKACPKGVRIPRPYKLKLTIGTPRTYSTIHAGRETAQQISSELRQAVQELL